MAEMSGKALAANAARTAQLARASHLRHGLDGEAARPYYAWQLTISLPLSCSIMGSIAFLVLQYPADFP